MPVPSPPRRLWLLAFTLWVSAQGLAATQQPSDQPARFRAGIDLVNLAVTVTDRDGRFVPNLTRDDFLVYEDDRPQAIIHFVSGRVPVSLGLAIDTSGSMAGDKILSAREALRRFVEDLLRPDDEVFVYRFSEEPELVQAWTSDRSSLHERLWALRPSGGTALYDTAAEAVTLAQSGRHRKKALVLISDGYDTNSVTTVSDVRAEIRQTDVLVYAVGIEGEAERHYWMPRPGRFRPPVRLPFPVPRLPGQPQPPVPPGLPIQPPTAVTSESRANAAALREMTDGSGGRTEVIRRASDLGPATARIASELSRQYFIGYPAAAPRDGQWHSIRVEVRNRAYIVRARRGYIAS